MAKQANTQIYAKLISCQIKMAIKIAFFNHKGGVGKTTTVFNVGWKLAELGKKVLLVDADTQCNLTLQTLGEDKYEDYYENNPKKNIKSYLAPAFDSQPILIKAAEVIRAKQANLSVIAGSLELSGLDTQLSMSFHLTNILTSMQNLPGSFDYLIQETAEANQIDYVLLDLNPSLSAINQDLLISSDYFIIPTSPDYFSVQSIKSLATILPAWENWAKKAREVFSNDNVIYPLPKTTPKFLGFTTNKFNLDSGMPQKDHQKMMDRIGKAVDEKLMPNLEKAGMVLPKQFYHQYSLQERSSQSSACIVEISDFYKSGVISQERNLPVFNIPSTELSDTQLKTKNWFKALYTYFADEIILRTNHATSY